VEGHAQTRSRPTVARTASNGRAEQCHVRTLERSNGAGIKPGPRETNHPCTNCPTPTECWLQVHGCPFETGVQ
jgi:hypothetical protein